jgi:hypothetical protein
MSSTFHQQTDGQSEVTNHVIVMYLRCLAGDRLKSWLTWLPWAEFCFNASYQTALKCSPFRVVYGKDPPALISYTPGAAWVMAVDWQIQDRDTFLEEVQEWLSQAQVTMKQYQDKSRCEVHFAVGDWVWVRLNQQTAVGVTTATPSKLGPMFYGPYRVLQKVGEVSYKVHLPQNARIHDVFHVSFLKKFIGTTPVVLVPLPGILHGKVIPTSDKVLKARLNRGVWEIHVQWVGRAASDVSWEDLQEFNQRYPQIQLVDKLFVG